MTERLYYRDPTLLEFRAVITDTGQKGNRVFTVLDKSAFYPTSGGQQYDTGHIEDIPVVEVVESPDGDVWHITNATVGERGQPVTGRVDAVRRLKNRQQHTAQHILSQVFIRLFDFETVSVHLGDDYGAVELNTKDVSEAQWDEVESHANDIISANLKVEILLVDSADTAKYPLRKLPQREGTIRVIKIGEFDYSACGGTHCHYTSEVRFLKILGQERMRGHVLVQFLAGKQALDDYTRRFKVTTSIAQRLTCHFGDLPERISKLEDENKHLRRELVEAQKELLPIRVEALAKDFRTIGDIKTVVAQIGECEPKLAGQMAALTSARIEGVCVLLSGERVVIAASEVSGRDASSISKVLVETFGLRGGGNKRQAQLGGASQELFSKLEEQLVKLLSHA